MQRDYYLEICDQTTLQQNTLGHSLHNSSIQSPAGFHKSPKQFSAKASNPNKKIKAFGEHTYGTPAGQSHLDHSGQMMSRPRNYKKKTVQVLVESNIEFTIDISDPETTCGWLQSEVVRKYYEVLER